MVETVIDCFCCWIIILMANFICRKLDNLFKKVSKKKLVKVRVKGDLYNSIFMNTIKQARFIASSMFCLKLQG